MTGSEPGSTAGDREPTGLADPTGSGPDQPLPAAPHPGPLLGSGPVPSYDTDRTFTLPNVLSFLRLAGVPLMLWLILGPRADGLAVLVLALGGFTDWLDGFLARRWHQTSRLGQLLDPIADRAYILAVLVGLSIREVIPWWLMVVLVGREVLMGLNVPLLRTRGFSALPVHFLGKAGTFCLLYAFPLVLLGHGEQGWLRMAATLGWAFVIWGTGLYWYSGFLYLRQTVALLRTFPRVSRSLPSGAAVS